MTVRVYPNPDLIPVPHSGPPKYAPQLTSRDGGKLYPIHEHNGWVDAQGNGRTDIVASHMHRIKNGVVQEDPSDGHTHVLTGLPVGAG